MLIFLVSSGEDFWVASSAMTPRSLLVAALFGLSMLQPLANLAEAAASPAAGVSAKPAAKKPATKKAPAQKAKPTADEVLE